MPVLECCLLNLSVNVLNNACNHRILFLGLKGHSLTMPSFFQGGWICLVTWRTWSQRWIQGWPTWVLRSGCNLDEDPAMATARPSSRSCHRMLIFMFLMSLGIRKLPHMVKSYLVLLTLSYAVGFFFHSKMMTNYKIGLWYSSFLNEYFYITIIVLLCLQVPVNVEDTEEVHSAIPSYWSLRPQRHQPWSHSHLLFLSRHPFFRRWLLYPLLWLSYPGDHYWQWEPSTVEECYCHRRGQLQLHVLDYNCC